ncbi:MAG: hypothetical protein JWN73_1856 [Betaproteobacteria bacterium]|nr:hypothetical protein [Betaproteobacteria bacterium]
MSLLQPESLRIGLEPRRISVVKLRGRWKREIVTAATAPVTVNPQAPKLDALFARLESPEFRTRNVEFVVADSLVRYYVVERPKGVRNNRELGDAITARFEEQFGLPAADWVMSADLEPASSSYLVCAAPRALVEAVKSGCAGARLRFGGMLPFMVSELNNFRHLLPKRDFWFAAALERSVALCYRGKREWRTARFHNVNGQAVTHLPTIAAREALREMVPEPRDIRCSGVTGNPSAIVTTSSVTLLGAGLWPGQGADWAGKYRLALSGVWP